MNKKQKKTLQRIIIAAILTVALALLFHFVALPWFVQLILWLVPYLVIGHDVLRKAFMGIKNGAFGSGFVYYFLIVPFVPVVFAELSYLIGLRQWKLFKPAKKCYFPLCRKAGRN